MSSWILASVEVLGHGTIAITPDTYLQPYVLPTMQESAAKAMEEALL